MKPVDLDIDDYHEVLQVFHNESDRAAAVLAGSFVECYLAKYLKSAMVSGVKDDLFDGNGPFSTYSQRVQTAHAFRLISETSKRDLELIGKIRNRFAHHPMHTSFGAAPILDWCNSLSTATVIPSASTASNLSSDNRNRFIVAISLLIADWHQALLSPRN